MWAEKSRERKEKQPRRSRAGYEVLHIFWIYLCVGARFLRWRVQLWLKQRHLVERTQTHMKKTLLVIRHGQTTWNIEHRLPGQVPGVMLTETGHKQAERLADALAVLPVSAVISSPLERARDTAAYMAKNRNLQLQFEPDLMDTNIGAWTGKVIEDLVKNDPAWKEYVKNPMEAPEGVETFSQVQQRVMAAIERWLAQENIGDYPAFVAHADVVKLIIAYYTGLEARRAGSLFIDNASVSIVELEKDHPPRVLAIGWSPHPGWLKPPVLVEAEKNKSDEQKVGEQKT